MNGTVGGLTDTVDGVVDDVVDGVNPLLPPELQLPDIDLPAARAPVAPASPRKVFAAEASLGVDRVARLGRVCFVDAIRAVHPAARLIPDGGGPEGRLRFFGI